MGLFSPEQRIRALLYWDALQNNALQYALHPDDRNSQEILAELQQASEQGNLVLATGDTIHLLRHSKITPRDAAITLAQANHAAITLYSDSLDKERKRQISGPIAWLRREAREAKLEVAVDQLARREVTWSKLAHEVH